MDAVWGENGGWDWSSQAGAKLRGFIGVGDLENMLFPVKSCSLRELLIQWYGVTRKAKASKSAKPINQAQRIIKRIVRKQIRIRSAG